MRQQDVFKALFYTVVTLITLVLHVSASAKDKNLVSSYPKWQQVFINYTTWNGHYVYNNKSYACRMGINSVDLDGNVIASFVDNSNHFDLKGYAIFERVIFNKTTIYQFTERFNGSFQLAGRLTWSDSQKYWMYTANVTIPLGRPFSQFKFMSNSDTTSSTTTGSKTTSVILGVVLTLAILGVIVMAGSMIWSYRKGLLRHIPMSYRTFRNPQEERRSSFDSREETVHI